MKVTGTEERVMREDLIEIMKDITDGHSPSPSREVNQEGDKRD